MKTSFASVPIMAALLSLTTAQSLDEQGCLKKNSVFHSLIVKFCTTDNLFVPSKYAAKGVDNGFNVIGIGGNCSPPQYVPQEYCHSQFYEMCVNGVQNQTYGDKDCQQWGLQTLGPGSGSVFGGVGGLHKGAAGK